MYWASRNKFKPFQCSCTQAITYQCYQRMWLGVNGDIYSHRMAYNQTYSGWFIIKPIVDGL